MRSGIDTDYSKVPFSLYLHPSFSSFPFHHTLHHTPFPPPKMPGLTAPSDYSKEPPRHPSLQINSKAQPNPLFLFFFLSFLPPKR